MSTLALVLLIVLILALVGVLPVWPHAGLGLGYTPSGIVVALVIVLIVLAATGRL